MNSVMSGNWKVVYVNQVVFGVMCCRVVMGGIVQIVVNVSDRAADFVVGFKSVHKPAVKH